VGLADSYASMRLEVGSAYTLVFFIVVLPVLWALQWLVHLFEKRHGN
jgi:putative spermidine/putrescine transport system permease protein